MGGVVRQVSGLQHKFKLIHSAQDDMPSRSSKNPTQLHVRQSGISVKVAGTSCRSYSRQCHLMMKVIRYLAQPAAVARAGLTAVRITFLPLQWLRLAGSDELLTYIKIKFNDQEEQWGSNIFASWQ